MDVLINHFGEPIWMRVEQLSGEVVHPDEEGNRQPVGKILVHTNPEIIDVEL